MNWKVPEMILALILFQTLSSEMSMSLACSLTVSTQSMPTPRLNKNLAMPSGRWSGPEKRCNVWLAMVGLMRGLSSEAPGICVPASSLSEVPCASIWFDRRARSAE